MYELVQAVDGDGGPCWDPTTGAPVRVAGVVRVIRGNYRCAEHAAAWANQLNARRLAKELETRRID